jgi:hypothetical protein
MTKEKFIEAIFSGLRNLFTYTIQAGLTQQHFIKPEYLATVSIAQSLAKLNNKDELEIKLEESTADFASSCLKTIIGNQIIKNVDSGRPGRVDIAIYTKNSNGYYPNKAFCCVEVKNINPSKYLTLLDIERLICFLNLKNCNGAVSCLQLSYFVCIEERFGITKEKIDDFVSELKLKYENLINDSCLLKEHQTFKVILEVLEYPSISESDILDLSDGDSEESYCSDNYCRVGIAIEFTQ